MQSITKINKNDGVQKAGAADGKDFLEFSINFCSCCETF